ncbi:hypothetical protein K505DRAFT_355091 [Melanomma pulvis-pyrius CBS 109.77]|uniref:Uncharacterized protein n=1 Tax=Melanomma pulvis-pyrius CBS 109.77 TaxID=1314802 RepID=A0A6A6XXA0_9PLEO|nr:hypothetical protein K505DRAFT_355091 [Melanomma pulvis-pyrius CBS 109.77]
MHQPTSFEDQSANRSFPILKLPLELQSKILGHLVGELTLFIGQNDSTVQIDYPIPLAIIRRASTFFLQETDRHVLKSWKTFIRADEFASVSRVWFSGTPFQIQVRRAEPRSFQFTSKYHGLEKVELDLTAGQYFAFFNVTVPPFDDSNWRDQFACTSAANYLKHTEHLVLRFSENFSDPWYNCENPLWAYEGLGNVSDPRMWPPRYRQNVCSNGLVIDWILSYGWASNALQYETLKSITLEGIIQPWVWEKWTSIFRKRREDPDFIHQPNIAAIENIGRVEAEVRGEAWDPTEFYAPRCSCTVKCSILRHGRLEEHGNVGVHEGWELPFGDDGETVRGDWNKGYVTPAWVLEGQRAEQKRLWREAQAKDKWEESKTNKSSEGLVVL